MVKRYFVYKQLTEKGAKLAGLGYTSWFYYPKDKGVWATFFEACWEDVLKNDRPARAWRAFDTIVSVSDLFREAPGR
jgi:hypothetical protein